MLKVCIKFFDEFDDLIHSVNFFIADIISYNDDLRKKFIKDYISYAMENFDKLTTIKIETEYKEPN